jgi:hypothetical protein
MSAEILAFPHSRNRGMVDRVARIMVKQPSIDDAERELVVVLEIMWDVLERVGIAEDYLDRECRLFAKAAWDRWQQLQREAGAA